jgi:bifunctional N-acetylglucosamine-1-phosphate-uridyltransferase/glucosamine-1-phosphate-acetyltransferase GlmU-like protein
MMKKPILVVMAAGIGSRFGGLKQMTPFGLHGESLIDYSLYDALKAGFQRVIFIVNHRIYDDFRTIVGRNVEDRMEVQYAFQELDMLPEGLTVPKERVKPWGTAHAVLCARDQIDAPFCALNGDDFYGREAFKSMYTFLTKPPADNEYCMIGYHLANTLSASGYVSRGQCFVDDKGFLENVIERVHIISTVDGPMYTEDGKTYLRLPEDMPVSMNIWGYTPGFVQKIAEHFPAFYRQAMAENPLKAEFYLPNLVGTLLQKKQITVQVLPTTDRWFGVTNPQDRPLVEQSLRELTAQGIYPNGLWK